MRQIINQLVMVHQKAICPETYEAPNIEVISIYPEDFLCNSNGSVNDPLQESDDWLELIK